MYTNDWLYAGPYEYFKKDYTFEGFLAHIKLYDTYLKESELKANTYLIITVRFWSKMGQNSNKRCDTIPSPI